MITMIKNEQFNYLIKSKYLICQFKRNSLDKEIIIQKYGIAFILFMDALFNKYYSLRELESFMKNGGQEFWYTGNDSKNDIDISYYMRKKAIKIGLELGLWSCNTKYNPNFLGSINKIDHFIIHWDKVNSFFSEI